MIRVEGDLDVELERQRKKVRFLKYLPYVMILPAMVFLLIFTFYPMLNLAYLSFFDYNLVNPKKKFVGFSNYKQIFFIKTDFKIALKNTAIYTVGVTSSLLVLSTLFAVWMQKNSLVNRFAQTALFTPHLIAMVSCGMIWSLLMDVDNGFLNAILEFFGFKGLKWLNSSKTAMFSVVLVSVWKSLGYYALVLLSSLKSIPTEIYEAAELDNASKTKQFFKITLPMLSPQLFFLLITMTIGSFKVFDTVRVMTDGGPGDATDVLAFYIYRYAFRLFKIGVASAAGTILMLILMILTVIYFKVLGKRVYYQ
jgi:sn-glycerol 3-phosphate transport system permease protein